MSTAAARPSKRGLGVSVLDAARARIAWTFDTFPRIYVSFSGGKDSTVMLHLVMEEAILRGRQVGVLIVDLEGQYALTIEHIRTCLQRYQEHIEPYWVCLPLHLRNAVSMFETHWLCWDPERERDWIRQPPPEAIRDETYFPFFSRGMEFEEFVPAFGRWYAQGQLCACFVGIRADESLNRWRTIAGHGTKFEGHRYTNYSGGTLYNVYPIYDWRVEDLWTYHGRHPDLPHNALYDRMHQAGLTLSQMRICQPYGDDQRRGLWLFHVIEPETWARVVARVNGANSGALYVRESGNITGYRRISKPEGHTWQSFAHLLLASLPPRTREHYENKFAVFLHWWQDRGYPDGIPDEADLAEEAAHRVPSWRRICKVLLRNDYWCKEMSFGMHKSQAYERYRKLMRKRRQQWGLF
jgi:predicted phosphoadenosine phosphosulfate sulfurtransferase